MKAPASGTGVRAKGNEMTILKRLWIDESGASAAEYALILAIVGTALAAAAVFLGGVIATEINSTGTCIQSEGATCN
jgi:pilus assembly protein Flp/PilA